jgi:uncharacterized membrane protein
MTIYLLAILIGIIAGLRTMTALAAVSWAAHLGAIHLEGTWLAFFGSVYAVWIFTIAAVGELVTDQLPRTPSRKVPVQFGARIVSGGLSGAAVVAAADAHAWLIGVAFGALGAVLGTLGGARARSRLAAGLHRDQPAAFIEDAVAIGGAALAMAALL